MNKIPVVIVINYKLLNLSCVLMVTFSEGNCLTEVEENDSKDTLACDDDAHKAVFCARCPFFHKRLVRRVLKKMVSKIFLTLKG